MGNPLNITASNFNNDVAKAFMGDVTVQLALIDSTTKVAGTFYPIGKFKAEGKAVKVDTEYAELFTGIPQVLADKAPTKRVYTFEADLVNLQIENLALCLNAYIDDSGANKRLIFGENIPATLEVCLILSGEQRDGKDLDIYIRKGQITPEAVELMLGAPEFASVKFTTNIVPDPHPHRTNFDWPVKDDYDLASVTSDGTTTVLLADTTEATVGDYLYSEAGGFWGIIVSIVTDTSITLDRTVAAESAVAVIGITPADILNDNVFYFEEEA
jgi:hypothetical protein